MAQRWPKTGLLTPKSVTWAAIGADCALSAGKVTIGIVFGSQAIMADGMHSASDLITDLAVLAGLAISRKPADSDHPYGHRRVTTLVAAFVGAVLLIAAVWIAYNAITSLNRPAKPLRAALPFVLAVAAIPIKEFLYRITTSVGRREGDMSLLANAWHHRTDAFTSVTAALGLAGVLLGGPRWQMLDALTALVLGAFLIVVAVRIIHNSAEELADRAPSAETLAGIQQAVAGTEGVTSFHAFRARQVGGKVEMDIHIQVDPALTVAQGHSIASEVELATMAADTDVISVTVHVEPAGMDDPAG